MEEAQNKRIKIELKKAIIVQLSPRHLGQLNGGGPKGEDDILKLTKTCKDCKTKFTCGVCTTAWLTCSPE